MTTRRVFHAVALAVVIETTAFVPVCLAETKVMTAEASYTMGDGESPTFAEAQVLQKAKQAALEQAGTYVEAYSKTHNYDLTTEEIQTLAGGVLKVEVLEKTRTLVGDGLRFSIKIKATVTTDKMEELAQRIRGKNVAEEYKKLQAEYARLSREVETWKQRAAKTPQGPERDAALDQIREREKAFGAIQRKESALFQRLVSGEQLIVSAADEKAEVDQLLEFIKERGHVIEMDKIRAFAAGSKDSLKLTVPIRLKHASLLPAVLSDAARKLGGDEVRGLPSNYKLKDRCMFCDVNWTTLRYSVPDILREKLTLRTAPRVAGYSPMDNLYRQGLYSKSSYYIQTPGSVVRLSRSRPIEDYFHRRISDLVLLVELRYTDRGLVSERCSVPYMVNRLIPVKKGKDTYDYDFPVKADYLVGEGDSDDPSMLLLLEETTFNLEFWLPPERTKKLNRVIAWFDDRQNAPSTVCNTVVRND